MTHRHRTARHLALVVVVAALAGLLFAHVSSSFAPFAAVTASGVAATAVAVHVGIVALFAGALVTAARAHRRERKANDGRGLTLHAPLAYDFLASLYTLGRETRMRARTLDVAGVKAGDRVLDVCCGTGTLAVAAQERVGANGEVHGIDAAPEMIERARAKAARRNANVSFAVAEAQALPFADASFDVVTCSLALHHLPAAVRALAVREMKRVLKPGGRVLVVEFAQTGGALSSLLHPMAVVHRRKEKFLDLAVAAMNEAAFAHVESGSLQFADLGFALASSTGDARP